MATAVLRVEVRQIRGRQGVVRLALFASENGFPSRHGKAIRTRVLPALDTSLATAFEGIAPGSYAVAAIHDANDNAKLDTNWLGTPTEGFGVSNDAPARFGPPRFEDARFSFCGPTAPITIRMRYP